MYTVGRRDKLPVKKRRQLRNIDISMRQSMNLVYSHQQPGSGPIFDYFMTHLDQVGRFLIHMPFGLFLRTVSGLNETLVPLGPITRRAVDDWHVERIGLSHFHIGSLFGLVPILVRLTTQRIMFYIPPTKLDMEDIRNSGPLFRDFHIITIERSIPNWNGHVTSMVQILALAVNLHVSFQKENFNAKQNIGLFFQNMAEKIIADNEIDIFAMSELLNIDAQKYAISMLDAIDQFIDAKN